ncbi:MULTISPECIES: hypothetical protein [Protofrankia]|uniref:Uncharacterized protein n=1 Tax=Candidatus Protofrankia datiscae TaxID=2716812 RepID=F8AUR7_9ACTN|nr:MULTISPECIES: hypothetical protein [Protofrankia]AEH08111.1 hypothetical protein FsymDg_0581 [Candidatus Protofrankia datiscae]
MSRRPDKLVAYEPVLARHPPTDPWRHTAGARPCYTPDYGLLGELLTQPVRGGEASESGAFAKGIDAWIAHELRRAGFGADEVWPRASQPRVLPRDVAVLLDKLPKALADEVRARVGAMPAVTPADAVILGRAYDKQVDVVISRWERGPELLISTKAQVSSFGKNLPNRFEEAYGDAGNLRGRYPLAAVGFLFVQRSTILDTEPDTFERTIDMIRKLRAGAGVPGGVGVGADSGGYTATALVLVEWDDIADGPAAGPALAPSGVRVRHDVVPADVAAPQFFTTLIRHITAVTPVVHHVRVRELLERRNLPVAEADADALTAEANTAAGTDPATRATEPTGPLMIDVPLFPDL